MTDDKRMDRARRIREMREGSRANNDAQADDRDEAGATDGGGDANTTDGDASTDGASDDGADEAIADTDTDATDDAAADTDADDADADDPDVPDDTDTAADSGADTAADIDAAADTDAMADADSGDDATMHIPGAEVGDVEVDVAEMARQAGLESADGASDGSGDSASTGGDIGDGETEGSATGGDTRAAAGETGAAARAGAESSDAAEETRVLEFTLGDEQYCLDIEYVEEIVKRETVTRVPNTPDCVEGVVDLRGQITTILDPKVLLDIDTEGSKDLIVVFDPEQFDDQGAVGWVVDDVDRVTPVTEDEVNSSPVDQDHVNGVVDRDGEFVIWTTPELDVEAMAG